MIVTPKCCDNRLLGAVVALIFALFAAVQPAQAVLRQGVGASQSGTPVIIPLGVCDDPYTVLVDGIYDIPDGFCPVSGQANYWVKLDYNRPQNEYATRIAIWANAGSLYDDNELRIFNVEIEYVDPLTLQTLTYTATNVQIADTQNRQTPVYYNLPFNMYGLKSVKMINLRNIPTPNATYDEAAFREVQVDTTVDTARAANVRMMKSSTLYSGNPSPNFAIPGNDVMYTITVSNRGNLGVDANSIFLIDLLPSQLTFFNGDADGAGPGTGVVQFSNSGTAMTFPPGTIAYATAAPSNFAACNYNPVAGYDPLVRYVCIKPTGVLSGTTTTTYPTFTASFRARIK